MKNIIEIKNLDKSFQDVHAVDDLSLVVKEGELFAFLGVNGAGKSTTISIMCGTLSKDGGEVIIDGMNVDNDMKSITKEIGVVYQTSALDAKLSVKDNLTSRASLYGITGKAAKERIAALSEMLDFKELLPRTFEKLSGGQKRRVDVARALIHNPKILILDEPTTGLDPEARKLLWNVVTNLRKSRNMTVFLTTHYMEEAADADYVIILDRGEIAAEGTPLELKNRYTGDYITVYGKTEDEIKKLGAPYEAVHGAFKVSLPDTAAATRLIVKYPEVFVDY